MEFFNLPNEVLQNIFSFLDHHSRLMVLEVCRGWEALASTNQFTDRIWFRMVIRETKFMRQVKALQNSSRRYRHVVIDCEAYSIERLNPKSVRRSQKLKIEKLLTALNNVETLVVFKLVDMKAADLLILLQNVSNLKRLCLLDQKVNHLHELCFSGLPKIVCWWSDTNRSSWTEILTTPSRLVLQNVTDMTLTVPLNLKLRVDVIQQMLPNLTQLQITVTDPSIINLIDAYKNQLEKLSIFSITSPLLTLFCDIKFPQLSHFSLNTDHTLDQMAITKCEHFFKSLYHTRNLRHLKLFLSNTSIIRTICSNCTSLRVLEVFTTNIAFLENISNLRHLQKLSIRRRDCNRYNSGLFDLEQYSNPEELQNQQPVQAGNFYEPIESLKILEISGSFPSANELLKFLHTTGPNLETLVLEDIAEPAEALRILSGSSPNIRHLKLSFKRKPGEPPELDFGYLMNKTDLVTCTLENVLFVNKDSIPKWIQSAPNLNRLLIMNCRTLNSAHLTILNTCCPTLSQLELMGCYRLSAEGLQRLKRKLPHVAIIYDPRIYGTLFLST